MDWGAIEKEVYYQTQQVVSVSAVGGSSVRPPSDPYWDDNNERENQPGAANAYATLFPSAHHSVPKTFTEEFGALERYLNELRNVSVQQGKKVMKIENVLTTYSDVLDATASSQHAINERIDHLESGVRQGTKAAVEASNDRSTITIQIKTLGGKLDSLEQYLQQNEMCYATKESFAQVRAVGLPGYRRSRRHPRGAHIVFALRVFPAPTPSAPSSPIAASIHSYSCWTPPWRRSKAWALWSLPPAPRARNPCRSWRP